MCTQHYVCTQMLIMDYRKWCSTALKQLSNACTSSVTNKQYQVITDMPGSWRVLIDLGSVVLYPYTPQFAHCPLKHAEKISHLLEATQDVTAIASKSWLRRIHCDVTMIS